MAKPKLSDVAALAGVSPTTVSRVLNNRGYLSENTRTKVHDAMRELGYRPNAIARSLQGQRSQMVGLIFPTVANPFYGEMVYRLESYLAEAGYRVILCNSDDHPEQEKRYLEMLFSNQVDGIILIATVFTPAHEEVLGGLTLPLVVLNQSHPGKSCVYQNNEGALHDITELALKKGTRPAYIGVHEEDTSAGRMSHRGFLDACHEAGVEVPERAQVVTTSTVDTGYMAAEQILHDYPEVDTIVCATDSIAYGTLTCLQEYGHRVPEDIQVTGIGDGDLSQIVNPTLTTVHPYYKTSGIEAAKMLVGLMNDSDTAQRDIRMGYELVVRNSTR